MFSVPSYSAVSDYSAARANSYVRIKIIY